VLSFKEAKAEVNVVIHQEGKEEREEGLLGETKEWELG
jgi:hypothetical protein